MKSYIGCLKPLAAKSSDARRRFEPGVDIYEGIDPYVMDQIIIADSKSFRKLGDKTQVITAPWNGLVRNRNSHTMEVVGVAVSIASMLGLNIDLARAIALGHDIGHVPFGHKGEDFLSQYLKRNFSHAIFGSIVAQLVERKGQGLNLTLQVLFGILEHSRRSGKFSASPHASQEATVAMYSDKIAYILSDFNDVVVRQSMQAWAPEVTRLMNKLGSDQRSRKKSLLEALCLESEKEGCVSFGSSEQATIFSDIKKEMYKLYPLVNIHSCEEGMLRVMKFLEQLFADKAPLVFCLMTDNDILSLLHKNTFDITDLRQTSVWEQVSYIVNLPTIDLFDACLNW